MICKYQSCQSLEEVTFGSGITHIAFYSFTACSALKSLTIPAGVVSMGAFFDNTNVEDVYCWADPAQMYWWSNNRDFKPNKGTSFHVMDKTAWEAKFPEANVTFVQDLVPAGTLTYSVNQGVAHVTGITSDNPTGVVMIPATYSYEGADYPVTTIASAAFKNKTGLTSVSFPSVSVIAANAFEGCTGLTTLNLPASLTSIGTEAFKGCTGLRSVVIDANFGGSLFAGCDNISAITFGENITSIGAAAFQNLPGLTSVTIPANVTSIGGEAFDGCGNLSTITFLGTTPPATYGAQLYGIASNFAMRVPTGSVDAYRAHDIWGHYPTHIECMPWKGSGTESDPYLISHKDELDLLAKRVNEGNTYFETYFKLTEDITYDPSALYFDGGKSNYIPIGNSSSYNSDFWGTFDGDGHTISGIRIDRSGGGDQNELALFGRSMKYEAVIKNLILDDTQISGKSYIAGILACGACTVTNCHVTKRVIIDASLNDAFFHGGIAGMTYGMTVNHCTSAATLTIADGITEHNYFGAIAGNSWGEQLNDNLAIGATIPATSVGDHGAIAGCSPWYLERNYYTACTVAGVEDALGVGGAYNETVRDHSDNDGAVSALRDDADNSTAIGLFAALPATLDLGFGAGQYPMQIAGRTLYKDGDWNTLCLPFSLTAEQIAASELNGAVIKELVTEGDGASNLSADGLLTLKFQNVTSVEAGKPYIVKWPVTDSNIENPVFSGVTITSTAPTAVSFSNEQGDACQFVGQYSPFSVGEAPNDLTDGSIITYKGREAIVVTLNGKKYAIATSNETALPDSPETNTKAPASGETGYGYTYYTFNDACKLFANGKTDGSYTDADVWRLPTQDELIALKDICWDGSAWKSGASFDGGLKLTIGSASLLLPAAGYYGGNTILVYDEGIYWSSTPLEEEYAFPLIFLRGGCYTQFEYRKHGYSVRLFCQLSDEEVAKLTANADGHLDEIVMLGSDNQLGYSNVARTLRPFRAHFRIPSNRAAGARAMTRYAIDFGDENTGISEERRVKSEEFATPTVYTLQGIRISPDAMQQGQIYIVNGKKTIKQ